MTEDDKYAFACASENGHQPGMTLRDYFAAQAMNGIVRVTDKQMTEAEIAEDAYKLADAMLVARK